MARVNLYQDEIQKVIDDRGHRCIWERAAVCSCLSRDSGQPDFTCRRCGGTGYIYLPPQEVIVAATMIDSRYQQNTLQFYEPGTLYLTPSRDIIMGYRDRLRFPDFRCLFSEVIRFDDSRTSRRTYRNIVEPIHMCDIEYEFETPGDYIVTEDRYHIRYVGDEYEQHVKGHSFSLLYYTTPSYLVVDLVHELRATLSDRNSSTGEPVFIELPKQYRARREDFIYGVAEPEQTHTEEQDNTGAVAENGTIAGEMNRTDFGYAI